MEHRPFQVITLYSFVTMWRLMDTLRCHHQQQCSRNPFFHRWMTMMMVVRVMRMSLIVGWKGIEFARVCKHLHCTSKFSKLTLGIRFVVYLLSSKLCQKIAFPIKLKVVATKTHKSFFLSKIARIFMSKPKYPWLKQFVQVVETLIINYVEFSQQITTLFEIGF